MCGVTCAIYYVYDGGYIIFSAHLYNINQMWVFSPLYIASVMLHMRFIIYVVEVIYVYGCL